MFDKLQKFWWKRQRLAAARRAIREAGPGLHPIFILGLSRSGSTWLQEMIGAWPHTLNLFEPIHRRIRGTLPASTLEDTAPSDSLSPAERRVLDGILTGRLLTPKTLQPGKLPKQISRVSIKLINCNNGLPRLTHDLQLRYRPLVILRHPCAHVASWKRLGWAGRFGDFQSRVPHLLATCPGYRSAVAGLSKPVELMAASWCLGNHVPLTTDPAGRWHVVRYETLRDNPAATLAGIFEAWSEPAIPAEVSAATNKPSRTTWREDNAAAPIPPNSWTADLTPDEESTVYATCARFGITVTRDNY